jgi:SAM-dependent methyltransferase
MERGGMVHALEEIRRLLRAGGCLIDIHPVRDAPIVEVRTSDGVTFSEPSAAYDYDDDLSHAERALTTAVRRGLFALDGSHEFEFHTSARSVRELRDFFAVYSAYEEDVVDDEVEARVDTFYERVDAVMRSSGRDARVVHRERARMSRLNPTLIRAHPSAERS